MKIQVLCAFSYLFVFVRMVLLQISFRYRRSLFPGYSFLNILFLPTSLLLYFRVVQFRMARVDLIQVSRVSFIFFSGT